MATICDLSQDLVEKTLSEVPATTICDLPPKLVEKILSKVPITSLGAVRNTWKGWNALSKEKVICQEGAERNEFVGFMVKNYRVCLLSFDLELADPSPSPSIKEIRDVFGKVEISKVLQCNGLLLCVAKDNARLVVWNPYLGQIRWIEPRTTYHELDRYAIGYAKNREHKILRFLDDELGGVGKDVFGYEIYDFSSNAWRVLDITPNWDIQCYQIGVSLKGNTYFFAKEKIPEGPEGVLEPVDVLLCFDFTKESFGPFLPLPFPHYSFDTGALSCLRDEKLAALHQNELADSEVEIWVTTSVSPDAVSWVPFLKVDLVPFLGLDFQFDIGAASFFIDEEMQTAVVFHLDEISDTACCDTAYMIDGVNGSVRKVALGEAVFHPSGDCNFRGIVYSHPLVCSTSYTPSLVQIKLKDRMLKRKMNP